MPYFWGDAAGSSIATNSIVAELNADNYDPIATTEVVTPYGPDGNTNIWAYYADFVSPSYQVAGPDSFSASTSTAFTGYAQYEPSQIPEPGTILLGFVVCGTLLIHKAVRRQTH